MAQLYILALAIIAGIVEIGHTLTCHDDLQETLQQYTESIQMIRVQCCNNGNPEIKTCGNDVSCLDICGEVTNVTCAKSVPEHEDPIHCPSSTAEYSHIMLLPPGPAGCGHGCRQMAQKEGCEDNICSQRDKSGQTWFDPCCQCTFCSKASQCKYCMSCSECPGCVHKQNVEFLGSDITSNTSTNTWEGCRGYCYGKGYFKWAPHLKPKIWEANWLMKGKEVKTVRSKTLKKCWAKCQNRKDCNFIAWKKKREQNCLMFKANRGGTAKTGWFSGPEPECFCYSKKPRTTSRPDWVSGSCLHHEQDG